MTNRNQEKKMTLTQLFINIKYDYRNQYNDSLLIDVIRNHIPGIESLYPNLVVSNEEKLGYFERIIPFAVNGNIIGELLWAYKIIEKHFELISEFIQYRELYEKYFFSGEYTKAKEVLNLINTEITYSFWGIEQEFCLAERQYDFVRNRELLAEKAKIGRSVLYHMLCEILSHKAELDSSVLGYEKKLERYSSSNKDNIVGDYIKCRYSLQYHDIDLEEMRAVIFISSLQSIIDLYENMIDVLIKIVSSQKPKSEVYHYATELINNIYNKYGDLRLSSFYFLQKVQNGRCVSNEHISINKVYNNILEEYSSGNYVNSMNLIEREFNQISTVFEIYQIYAKCLINEGSPLTNSGWIRDDLFNNYLKPVYFIYTCKNREENIDKLIKACKTISHKSFYYEILYFCIRLGYKKGFDASTIKKLSFVSSTFVTPKLSLYSNDNDTRLRLIHEISKVLTCRNTIGLYKYYYTGNIDILLDLTIDPRRLDFYTHKRGLEELNDVDLGYFFDCFTKLQGTAEEEKSELDNFYTERIVNMLYTFLLRKGEVLKAVEVIVKAYYMNIDYIFRLNIEQIKLAINLLSKDERNRSFKVVVLMYLIDKSDYLEHNAALANTLEYYGCGLPHELISFYNQDDNFKEDILFILRRICTKEVLKRFPRLNPISRVEERLNILRFLLVEDTCNVVENRNEMNSIVKEQSISKNLVNVNNKRIYVDTEALYIENRNILYEMFKKYQSLKGLDLEFIAWDSQYEFYNYFYNEVPNTLNSDSEKMQRFLLFVEIVNHVRNEFLDNPKFGLDKFLSSRIRHTLLESNIFKLFKQHNLYSEKREIADTKFNYNQYWDVILRQNLSIIKEDDLITLKNVLSAFSQDITKIYHEVRKWMKIRNQENTDGMFYYEILSSSEYLNVYYGLISKIDDIKILYDNIISVLWNETDLILKNIRDRLNGELLDDMLRVINFFYESIDSLNNTSIPAFIITELKNSTILCRQLIGNELNQISQWFIYKKHDEYNDYYLEDLIRTCIKANNIIDQRNAKINVELQLSERLYLKGNTFYHLYDVIHNLYSNAVTKSEITNHEDMQIYIICDVVDNEFLSSDEFREFINSDESDISLDLLLKNDSNKLFLLMKNRLDANADVSNIMERIKNVKELSADDKRVDRISREEGGSGILKILSILKYNIPSDGFLTLSFIDDEMYYNALVVLDISKIRAQEKELEHENTTN